MAENVGLAVAENKNVIQIDESEWKRAEKTVHQPLVSLTSISKAERHEKKFKQSKWSYYRRFRNVSFVHWNLILEKIVRPCKKVERSCKFGSGYLSAVVTMFKRR